MNMENMNGWQPKYTTGCGGALALQNQRIQVAMLKEDRAVIWINGS